jgi:hypothetical protein
MSFFTRFVNRFRARRLDEDLHEEVDFHLDLRAGQHVKAGMNQEDAMKRARETFGDVGAVISGMRRARLGSLTTLVTMASVIAVLAGVLVVQIQRGGGGGTIPQPPPAPIILHPYALDAPAKTPPPPPPPPPTREQCLEQAKQVPRICQ